MYQHPIILQELGRQRQQELLQMADQARHARQARQERRSGLRAISMGEGAGRQWWWRLIHPRRVALPAPRPANAMGHS